MKISYKKFPIDIILCFILSGVLFFLIFFDIEVPFQYILGAPFILFIPGYVLLAALFPSQKPERRITLIERIFLSFGMSIAIVPLIGLGLNFSPRGIRLDSMLLSLCFFIFGIGSFALYRWYRTPPEERYSISFDVSFPTFNNRVDQALTIILAALIITSVSLVLYVIVVPKVGEKFTEFYVLGSGGGADDYPQNLSSGENASVLIGITNHEYRVMNYTVEVWLINQTTSYNTSENKNVTSVDHMWFLDKISIELAHTPVDLNTLEVPQWEDNYSFSLHRAGRFKLAFLLFTEPTEDFLLDEDYKEMADQILSGAYRDVHLWVTVS